MSKPCVAHTLSRATSCRPQLPLCEETKVHIRIHVITITLPSPEHETVQQRRSHASLLPPYKVVLHHDNVHSMHEVIEALITSVPMSIQEAQRITLTAHQTGTATVRVCPREEAEYYKERLETHQLTVSMRAAS